MGWQETTNWGDHDPVEVCLFTWAHPATYSGTGIMMSEAMPLDAVLTAFFTCMGGMKRMQQVRLGKLNHVPADALRASWISYFFPPAIGPYPKLVSLFGVTLIWGTLWSAMCMLILVIMWLTPIGGLPHTSYCMNGWSYIFTRACWSTTEGVLVAVGSFLMWCSHVDDPDKCTVAERSQQRRLEEERAARGRAASFACLNPCMLIVGVCVVGFAAVAHLLAKGIPPLVFWLAVTVGMITVLTSIIGCYLTKHHRRDEAHAARNMRPGLALGVYLTLTLGIFESSAIVGVLTLTQVNYAMKFVLQNWAWVSRLVLPFTSSLDAAEDSAAKMHSIAICCFVLTFFSALVGLTAITVLSPRGAASLLPSAAAISALILSIVAAIAGFILGPNACLASQVGGYGVRTLIIAAVILALVSSWRLAFPTALRRPIVSTLYFLILVALGCVHIVGAVLCTIGSNEAINSVTERWDTILQLLGPHDFQCSGDRLPLFAAAAQGDLALFAVLSCASAFTVLLLFFAFVAERRRRGGRRGRVGALPSAASWNSRLSGKPQHEPLMSGRPGDEPIEGGERSVWGVTERYHEASGVRSTARTTLLSEHDATLTHRIFYSNAEILSRKVREGCGRLNAAAPRIACPLQSVFVLLCLLGAYVSIHVFLDSTQPARIAFHANSNFARKHLSHEYFKNDTLTINVKHSFRKGLVNVQLLPEAPSPPAPGPPVALSGAVAYVASESLRALAASFAASLSAPPPAPDVPTEATVTSMLTVDSSSIHIDAFNALQHSFDPSAMVLNITVTPPEKCDEACPAAWFWFPCNCHAIANLTILIPKGPPGAKLFITTDHATVTIGPQLGQTGPGLKHMMDTLSVDTEGGDVTVKSLVAGGPLLINSRKGQATVEGVVAQAIDVTSYSLALSTCVVVQAFCVGYYNVLAGIEHPPGKYNSWKGSKDCEELPLPPEIPNTGWPVPPRFPNYPLNPNSSIPIGLVLGDLSMTTTGGTMLVKGTNAAATTYLNKQGDGTAVVSGGQFSGVLEASSNGGTVAFTNVVALGCEEEAPGKALCVPSASVEDGLPPAALSVPISPNDTQFYALAHRIDLLCLCDLHGRSRSNANIVFSGTEDAVLAASFLISHTVNTSTDTGKQAITEAYMLGGPNGTALPASLTMTSKLGGITLNGVLAPKATADTFQCEIASKAGDIRLLFDGGAINGTWDVTTVGGSHGIGHVGVVLDNLPVEHRAGMIGAGNGRLHVQNEYGSVGLAMSSKPPGLGAMITGAPPKLPTFRDHIGVHLLEASMAGALVAVAATAPIRAASAEAQQAAKTVAAAKPAASE